MKGRTWKRLLAAMLCGMLVAATAVIPTAAADVNISVVERDMNFRSGPGTNYRVMGSVPAGASVQILSVSNDWIRIKYSGITGWIHGGNLKDQTVTIQQPQQTQTQTAAQQTLTADLNLRSGPGTGYMILDTVPAGTAVTVKEVSGTWARIIYNGQSGWISRNFFTVKQSSTAPWGGNTGGNSGVQFPNAQTPGETWTVKVDSGYLALRTEKAFEYENEIGKLYTGQTVRVTQKPSGDYWIVYAPTLGKGGYVNKNYLVKNSTGIGQKVTKTVKVESGYLALRTEKAFEYENEIGKLWTGDKVEVISQDAGTYWYVYAPTLGKKGYVNKNYLF